MVDEVGAVVRRLEWAGERRESGIGESEGRTSTILTEYGCFFDANRPFYRSSISIRVCYAACLYRLKLTSFERGDKQCGSSLVTRGYIIFDFDI